MSSRELVCTEDGADKFWRITLAGDSFEVVFGRSGTDGQTMNKSFPSAAAALRAHDALVAQKLRKGYVDAGASPAKPVAAAKAVTAKKAAVPAPAAPLQPEESAAPAATLAPGERSIDLSDLDWRWATWRKLPPLPPLAERPFDLDEVLGRVAKLKAPSKYASSFGFDKAGLKPGMSKQEARIWYECMVGVDLKKSPQVLAQSLAKKKLAPLTIKQVIQDMTKKKPFCMDPEMMIVLAALFTPMEITEHLVVDDKLTGGGGYRGAGDLFYAYRDIVSVRLTEQEREQLRTLIRPKLTPAAFPTDPYEMPPGEFLLAPLIGGLYDELDAVVRSWPEDRFGKEDWDDAYHLPQHIVMGLGSKERVITEVRRLRVQLRQPEYMTAFIAHTEFSALDDAAKSIIANKNKQEAAKLAEVLAKVHAPENTAPMEAVMKKSKAPQVGQAWLDAHKEIGGGKTASAKVERPAIEDVTTLLEALKKSTLDKPDPRIAQFKKKNDAATLDAFSWDLFQSWLYGGAPSKEKWKMAGLAFLGGDESALKLAPMVRAWPGESQHQRAVLGLECLRGIGTDVALTQLSGIALKVKFQALKARANECMNDIAAARGMKRAELEDRIVPDAGFDAEGKRSFSFGPRKFEVVLGTGGSFVLKDEAGQRRDDLPKPSAKDDADVAKKAGEEWKLFKKTLREASKIQIERLERAMVTGRSWNVSDYESLLVRHPLMGHLVRLLLWGAYDGDGKLTQTFRVAEDRSYADSSDNAVVLPKKATVRIVHPLELDEKTKAAWGQVFADYEILTPFEQLGRSTFAPTPAEAKTDDAAARFKGKKFPVRSFISRLRAAGWVHGAPQDAGLVYDHEKTFEASGLVAVIEQTGFPIGDPEWAEDQEIRQLYFVKASATGHKRAHVKLGAVDPIAFSEVMFDLSKL